MIELGKRDIRAVASNRFTHTHKWHLIGWIVGIVLIAVITVKLTPLETSWVVKLIAFIPLLAVYVLGAIWWVKAQDKAIKALVSDCEKDPQLNYK